MIPCTPTGAVITGAGMLAPSTVVCALRFVAPVSIRGTMRQWSNASRLARAVAPDPAEPAAYQNGSGSIRLCASASSAVRSVVSTGRAPATPSR